MCAKNPYFYWYFWHFEKIHRVIVIDTAIVRFFVAKVDARLYGERCTGRRIYASLSGVAVFSIVL